MNTEIHTREYKYQSKTKTNFKQQFYPIRRLNSYPAQTTSLVCLFVPFSLNKPTGGSARIIQHNSGAIVRKGMDKCRSKQK